MATVMPEIVYGTKEEGHVMSDKVSQLASSVYSEFEKMIKKYDEDVVKELMPLVVGILENLDLAYLEKQEVDVELELIKEDNEQLLTQYEREKQLRKTSDQKYLELEDETIDYRKETEEKVESLESIVRMLELKNKNTTDHLSRMEDKESESKKEYNKIHERYTELMRTHMDYMERAKLLMGPDRITEMANNSRSRGGFQMPNLRSVNMMSFPGGGNFTSAGSPPDANEFDSMYSRNAECNYSIKSELRDQDSLDINSNTGIQVVLTTEMSDKEQNTDKLDVREFATATKTKAEQHNLTEANLASVQEREIEIVHETDISDKTTNAATVYVENKIMLSKPSAETELHLSSKNENQMSNGQQIIDKTVETHNLHKDENVGNVSQENSEAISVENKQVKINERSRGVLKKHVCKEMHKKIKPGKKNVSTIKEPELPTSPVYDPNDFSYEEDVTPRLDETIARIVATTPELEEMDESMESSVSTNKGPKKNDVSIYDELDIRDLGDVDYGADITEGDDDKDERHSTGSDNFFGMSRELENLILENTELLTTKNALNIVKDDLIAKVDELTSEQEIFREEIVSLKAVKDKLHSRIQSLEEELKKTKEELEKKTQVQEAENEDDVPMAQRKRFTRVEMARVLMERNQYKERLMELQEAVRWTEMIRATRGQPEISHSKKKSSIWNFFSNLFSSPNKPTKKPLPVAMIKYNAPTTNVQPVSDLNQKNRSLYNLGDKSKAFDFLQDDLDHSLGEPIVPQPDTSEKAKKERENERKEQYKQVRAHVKKDDGRMQAYGWSLPAKFQPQMPSASQTKSSVPVPVPVYCRPLLDGEPSVKILCAAGINLTGGRTKDGGCIVGASVFYSSPSEIDFKKNIENNEVDQLDQELKDHEYNLKQSEKEHLSSFVWICMSGQSGSCVSVIDANHPGEILETFRVSTTPILCIASVPGALESDYPVDEDILKAESYPQYPEPMTDTSNKDSGKDVVEETGIGGISFVQCATGTAERSNPISPVGSPTRSRDTSPVRTNITDAVSDAFSKHEETSQPVVFKARGSPASSGTATPEASGGIMSRRLLNTPSEVVRDGINALASGSNIQDEEVEKMSSVLPTVWLGTSSGSLYIHSSVSQWRRCLHSLKLRESILHIVHVKGRVLVALADGSVAIFHRDTDGQWDVQNYHLLDLGKPHHSIRCMTVIANKHVWCGYRNKIHVVDPQCMSIAKSFDAHPRKESQVRQLAWVGDGVWVSIRLDSTLRLYHAYTHQHLQDVDIEPYVSKMLGTGKLGFSFVRITSMLISCNRLWIGTGNGVIISVPLSEGNKQTVSMITPGSGRHGGPVRLYSDSKTDAVTPASFIPYCSMAQAQLSFHGHRDAVKFFAAVPGKKRKGISTMLSDEDNPCGEANIDDNTRLVISGGEGYVDFRIGDGDDDIIGDGEEEKSSLSKGDRSHLIVWQVCGPE